MTPEGIINMMNVTFINYFSGLRAGCLATAGVLTMGLVSMAQGKTNRSQLFMRLRVLSQGLTVAALIGGVLVGATKK